MHRAHGRISKYNYDLIIAEINQLLFMFSLASCWNRRPGLNSTKMLSSENYNAIIHVKLITFYKIESSE